jgi:hypothetical protein
MTHRARSERSISHPLKRSTGVRRAPLCGNPDDGLGPSDQRGEARSGLGDFGPARPVRAIPVTAIRKQSTLPSQSAVPEWGPRPMMRDDEDVVLDAVVALIEEAFTTVGTLPEYDSERSLYPWVRADPQHFRLELQTFDLDSGFQDARELLPTLSGYGRAIEALSQDPAIGPIVGLLFGDSLGGSLVDPEQLLYGILLRAAGRTDPRRVIDARLAELRAVFGGTSVTSRVLAPLPDGFRSAVSSPIVLDRNTSIRLLTDLDIATALHVGLRFRDIPDTWGIVYVGEPWGIDVAYELPVVIRSGAEDTPTEQMDGAINAQNEADNRLDRVIQALRLAQSGRVSVIGGMHIRHSDAVGGRSLQFMTTRLPRPPLDSYVLSTGNLTDAQTLFDRLGHPGVISSPALETAIGRFSSSIDRHDREDSLVDLIICAEALFAGDTGPGDLSMRVAQRFARYLEPTSDLSPMELFKHMKVAYDGRSKIVHAAKRTAKVHRAIARAVDSAALTEDLLRSAVRRALVETVEGGEFGVDWDRLVLEGE